MNVNELIDDWVITRSERPTDQIIKYFMSNNEYLLDRSNTRFMWDGISGSLFLFIYHKILNKEDREKIFDDPHDIRSPIKNNGLDGLYKYLTDLNYSKDYDASSEIKKFIHEATGIPFEKYEEQDQSLAYKVLAMFFIKYKDFPHFLTFLEGGSEEKTNFEFRFSHPTTKRGKKTKEDLDEISANNTAKYAEVLNLLTCQLPKNNLDIAFKLYLDVPILIENLIKPLEKVINSYPNKAGQKTIEKLTQEVFPKLDAPQLDRLDFKLHTALTIREYEVRIRSNKIITDLVLGHPLNLKTFYEGGVNVRNMTETQIISHLLGEPYVENKAINEKFLFLKQIIEGYKRGIDFNIFRTAVMKALIVHDSKLEITVPIQIQGAKNPPNSAHSIFRNLKSRKVVDSESGKVFFKNNGVEALSYFWEARTNFACVAVQQDSIEQGREIFRNRFESETIIDTSVIRYLKNANSEQVKDLPKILDRLKVKLLSW